MLKTLVPLHLIGKVIQPAHTRIRGYKMNWQPIETAPKDGTRIVVWDSTLNTFLDLVWVNTKRHLEFPVEAEWQYVDNYWYSLTPEPKPKPTHWLPITPPTKESIND